MAEATYQVIGKSVAKPDARLKATGAAVYAGDIRLPGMLKAKVLRSPHPDARIASRDIAAVAAVDEETAERALALIRIEYEPLAAVFDGTEALAADVPLVHPDLATYHGVAPTFGRERIE